MTTEIEITSQQIKSSTTSQSFSRGQSLYRQHVIEDAIRRGNELEAWCQGSQPEPYRVWAELDSSGIVATSCTCEYDWGGSCKHVVAMLLLWLHQPERFEEREAMQKALLQRTKEELAEIINQMATRYPDLHDIIDRPTPAAASRSETVIDTEPFRRELRRALKFSGGWMDRTAEHKVHEIALAGKRFAERGEYANAAAIYCAILAECNANDYPTDDEGEYVGSVSNTVDLLQDAVAHLDLAQNQELRQEVLDALVATFIWDVDFGGIGYGESAPDIIEEIVLPADIPRIRKQIEAAQSRKAANEYGEWGVEAFEVFLIVLDALDTVDPEETLNRLRARGMHRLLASKLLSLKRTDEAVAVIRTHMVTPYALLGALGLLVSHEQGQIALQLAEEAATKAYDAHLTRWLLEQYQANGDKEAYFRWQLKQMDFEPTIAHYIELKAAAEAVDKWAAVHPQILQQLTRAKLYAVLTLVYLHEQEWDLAWDTLEKTYSQPPSFSLWMPHSLEMTVAERSRHARPARAIPVYVKHVRKEIEQRNRKHYAVAAQLLKTLRELCLQIDEEEDWLQLITNLRDEFKQLPALQDEIKKAGL